MPAASFPRRKALALVVVVLGVAVAPCAADRPGRKGRRPAASALVATGEISSSDEAHSPGEIPNFDGVTGVRKELDDDLGKLWKSVTAATDQAKTTMNKAVEWKKKASQIPLAVQQVHSQTKEKVWEEVKNMGPHIAETERLAMLDLLKAVLHDVKGQKITHELTAPELEKMMKPDHEVITQLGRGAKDPTEHRSSGEHEVPEHHPHRPQPEEEPVPSPTPAPTHVPTPVQEESREEEDAEVRDDEVVPPPDNDQNLAANDVGDAAACIGIPVATGTSAPCSGGHVASCLEGQLGQECLANAQVVSSCGLDAALTDQCLLLPKTLTFPDYAPGEPKPVVTRAAIPGGHSWSLSLPHIKTSVETGKTLACYQDAEGNSKNNFRVEFRKVSEDGSPSIVLEVDEVDAEGLTNVHRVECGIKEDAETVDVVVSRNSNTLKVECGGDAPVEDQNEYTGKLPGDAGQVLQIGSCPGPGGSKFGGVIEAATFELLD